MSFCASLTVSVARTQATVQSSQYSSVGHSFQEGKTPLLVVALDTEYGPLLMGPARLCADRPAAKQRLRQPNLGPSQGPQRGKPTLRARAGTDPTRPSVSAGAPTQR